MKKVQQLATAISRPAIALATRFRRPIRLVLLILMMLALAGGAVRFMRGQYWLDSDRIVMTFYLVPMYLLVLGWAGVMLGLPRLLTPLAVWVDLLAVAIAASRCLTNAIPASGHVVFLLYAILITPHRLYRILAGSYLAATLVCKFALWHDFITPTLGALIALALWKLRARATGDAAVLQDARLKADK